MITRLSPLLDQFLRDSGWPTPRQQIVASHMDVALVFLHAHLGEWINLPLDATDRGYRAHGLNPFALKIGGIATNLIATMQAIDFNEPVHDTWLELKCVRRYGGADEEPAEKPTGRWYTRPDVPASRLALPPDQIVPYDYEFNGRAIPVLESIAGDMLVDWNMNPDHKPELGTDYHYRHGGGLQYLIPHAADVLTLIRSNGNRQ